MTTNSLTGRSAESQPPAAVEKRAGGSDQIIRSPQDFTQRLHVWREQNFHVLSPFANFSALPPNYGLVPTLVLIDPDPSPNGPGDVYQDTAFVRGNDVAISKLGLSKIAQAAGMSIKTVRTDSRLIPNLWEVKATARFIGLDGTPQELDGTEEYDLRDGSSRLKGFTPAQISQARAKGLRHCEGRAINAAIRLFGIKQKYSKAELGKPFVIVRVMHFPDMSDPLVRQSVTDRALAGTTALFPGQALPPAPVELGVIGVDPLDRSVIDVSVSKASGAAEVPVSVPAGRTLEAVDFDIEAGAYAVRLDGGELLTATKHEVGKALLAAAKAGSRVALVLDDAGQIAAFTVVAGAAASAADMPIGQTVLAALHRERAKPPKTWVRYDATFSDGRKVSTFETKFHALLDEVEKTRAAVKVTSEENGDYEDKLIGLEIVDSRQSSLPMGQGDRY